LKNDYTVNEIFAVVVPTLVDENTNAQIIDLLIGDISTENGPTSIQVLWAKQLATVFAFTR
jgi:hypothetical protein